MSDKCARFQEKINAVRRQSQKARRPSATAAPERRRSSVSEGLKQLAPHEILTVLEHYATIDGDQCVECLGALKDCSMQDSSKLHHSGRHGRHHSKRGSQKPKHGEVSTSLV
ncbi:expressed unknown protein [Seminavis robusta]|uniref:Uncharacterized protein n=1 Tax=Seminavis robusta TaxID=568900 RepID=A0A9N8EUQ9_9STRA|nr:expressed unknown protein [Seminavis robusta]|eukprot:Sro1818_g299600.1 n/a (112) ;mRNA; f:17212-17547